MFEAQPTELHPAPAMRAAAQRSALPRGYLAAWSALATIGIGYIGLATLQMSNLPELVAHSPSKAAPSRTTLQIAGTEVATLRQSMAEFQQDIGRMRIDLDTLGQDPTVVARLMAIEERMSITTGRPIAKRLMPPMPPPVENAPVAALPAPMPGSAESQPADLRQIALAPILLEAQTAPIETGSLANASKMAGQLPKLQPKPSPQGAAAPVSPVTINAVPQVRAAAPPVAAPTPAALGTADAPIAFGPAVVKAAPQPFAVQLSSGTSLDSIRLSWSLLSEQHNDTLGKLSPRFTSTGTDAAGQMFDLIAGPVKTAVDAKKICKALAARGQDCKVAPYGGEAF